MGSTWMFIIPTWLILLTSRRYTFAEYMPLFQPLNTELNSVAMAKSGTSREVALSNEPFVQFTFYNRRYNAVFLNDDGILTFNSPVPASVTAPEQLPINTGNRELKAMVLIAPFWATVDSDLNGNGNVYYSSLLTAPNAALLEAQKIVKTCYIGQTGFIATAGIVFTWDKVSDADDRTKENSFQAILVYNPTTSFVIFYYSDMSYVTQDSLIGSNIGIYSTGDAVGGLSYKYTDPKRPDPAELKTNTNCDRAAINGVYVFRVDQERPTSTGCDLERYSGNRAVEVSPSAGPMMGGNQIHIIPTCDVQNPICVFKQGKTVLQTVSNAQVDSVVICIPEPFFVTGDVSILIYKGESLKLTVKYTVEHPDDSAVTVSRLSPTSWNKAGSSLTINWDSAAFKLGTVQPSRVEVSILQYDESAAKQVPQWDVAYQLRASVENSGSFSFTPEAQDNFTEANSWGIIRVQAIDEYPVSLYSDVHMLGYLLHQTYQDDRTGWADAECIRWDATQETDVNKFLADIPPCPCTLGQARALVGLYLEQRGGCAINENDPSCTRISSERRICFYSTTARAGSECCYNGNELVFSLDDRSGGSSDKAAMLGFAPYALPGITPYLSHWAVDVMPYHLCCKWAQSTHCRKYLMRRWPQDCKEYADRKSAFVFGDPHFITFDEKRFMYNGIGEYRFMEVNQIDFKLYGRTKVATVTNKEDISVASFLNAVVMKQGESNTIHIERGLESRLLIYCDLGNGFRQPDFGAASRSKLRPTDYHILYLNGATLVIKRDFSQVTATFHRSLIMVDVVGYTEGITVEVISNRQDLGVVMGMLGNMDGDSNNDIVNSASPLIPYEGTDLMRIFETLRSWTTKGDTLFHRDGDLSADNYQNKTFIPVLETPNANTLPNSISNALETTCKSLEECIFDMSVTQSVSVGKETYDQHTRYQENQDLLKKEPVCQFLPKPVGGKVVFSNPQKKYRVETSVTFSCDSEEELLVGAQTRMCQSGGTWTSDDIPKCSVSKCDPRGIGGMDVTDPETNEDGNVIRITVSCAGNPSVKSTLTCSGGTWEGNRLACATGSSSGGLSGGAIAGIAIASIFVVLLIVVGVMFYLRRQYGVRNFDKTGTKVRESTPAQNWGLDDEAIDVTATKGSSLRNSSNV